ncbi:Alpha/beta hydrolase [Frankia sp. AiPs1]|uniref:alpha/beta fold hydrolase n=1 Tax=Frankia sp. AiPa1 TaxID=573492 RepID=UPI00202B6822|nr:alpha/beta hydrolase [Frankia sp. AiPa1]MCL9762949.1 alpha/beta hydrolase [Frankia sp. AiPa1]
MSTAVPPSTRTPVRRQWTGSSGLPLVGDDWGGPGQPVLLLHGGGQTRHAWGGTAAALAALGYRAIALDGRGHGESGWDPGGDYSLNAYVADLRAVLATIDGAPVLVGASLGGMTSLLAVGESGAALATALILVDVAPRIESSGTDRIKAFMTAYPDGFASLDEAADAIAAYLPGRRRPRDTGGLAKNLRLGPDGRHRWHWDPAFITGGPEAEVRTDRAARATAGVRIPTLLVRGMLSDVVSPRGAAELLELIPHARHVDVGGARHMVAGDRNDAFTAAIIEFLGELGPTPLPRPAD